MATSSRARFSLETLKEASLKVLDMKIDHAIELAESHEDDQAYEARMDTWRRSQSERVIRLAAQLQAEGVDDHRLAGFQIEKAPERSNSQDIQRDRERVMVLQQKREEMLAKIDSLVPDEDNTIRLTKTQLREFFGL